MKSTALERLLVAAQHGVQPDEGGQRIASHSGLADVCIGD